MKFTRLFLILLALGLGRAMADEPALWTRYPALSPDGRTIVFSYKDDIYKVSAQGGTAIPLTSNPAYDYMPVWSPDGRTIAFASDRYGNFDIFTVSVDGGPPRRLTYHSASQLPSAFSPDGKFILFTAAMEDDPANIQFPSPAYSELYAVPVQGGRVKRVLTTPAEEAKYDETGRHIIYQDRKGYENVWRKHHTSSVTRDIWIYDTKTGRHSQVTSFSGEDRSPAFSQDGKTVYYISEQFGTFNVCSCPVATPSQVTQLTHHKQHPVRFPTLAKDNTLCYSYNGEIYLKKPGQKSLKVDIHVAGDSKSNPVEFKRMTSEATAFDVSPDGKEVALIIRGEVYVTSVDYATTKRITDTPEQERSVSFSPDGKSLLYASERNGSWNIYRTTRVRDEETDFAHSTLLQEEIILEIPEETFQPAWSPDGKEVAYLHERTTLKVINLETKKSRVVLLAKYNYSYADGDQWFEWSPDSKWLLFHFISDGRWSYEVGLVSADGSQQLINLTQSGYTDALPRWMMDGKAIIWLSDRFGLRSHAGFGSELDVFGMFLTREAFDKFNMDEEEFKLVTAEEKQAEDLKKKEAGSDEGKKDKKTEAEDSGKPLEIDLKNIEDRKVRLTRHSAELREAVLSKDGSKLYYLASFERGFDLWEQDFKKDKTQLLVKLNSPTGSLKLSKDGNDLFVFANGRVTKISLASKAPSPVAYAAELELNSSEERAYMFEHAWRQIQKKFYDPNLHGVDWQFYRKAYTRFLPHISNNYDFAEMMSEMLGELNGSHTGAMYQPRFPDADKTAYLGVYYDWQHDGDGLKIAEIMDKSPLLGANSKIKAGMIIEAVDGVMITREMNAYPLFNRKAGKKMLLSLHDPVTDTRWQETVKAINFGQDYLMRYERWVDSREKETERLSNGRLGYVHIRAMDGDSYRVIFERIFGRHNNKEALIIDTRYNNGGNLVEDLTTLLSGEKYLTNIPRGQDLGIRPSDRWTKPSIVLMNEGNYSDAHGFPYAYKALGIGELVGMPVPGTMTSVWWEQLQDQTITFGMPQVGKYDLNGHYLENQQLEPDYLVKNDCEQMARGRDQQLEKAIEVMLKKLDSQ